MKFNELYNLIFEEFKEPKTTLMAPNGKPSNLPKKLWLLVRSEKFKNWFGDWEKDKEHSSKVIDENGEPLIVYHGTSKRFSRVNVKIGNQGIFWFSSNKQHILDGNSGAVGTSIILEMFVNIRNPADFEQYAKLGLYEYKGKGLDGAILKDSGDDYFNGFVLENNQVKLVN